ncbi:MAG: DNA replication/repair protein RecF [Candidatus Gracilibacteria bacterium]|nr:DNA replication/repair protein RecF [Candidatus Gracilibacteria bacterium]
MKLLKLQLENFRNYKSYSYEFDKENNFTIIKGPNGKGKTNLLEAIYALSLGKSFRTVMYDDLILWGMDYMRVKGIVDVDEENLELEVFYTNFPAKKKNFKKNGVSLKNSEYIGNLLTVLFQPEDLNILYLSPSLRRRYMDILLSQTDKAYLQALLKYNKALKQRNTLLNEIRKCRFGSLSFPRRRESTSLTTDISPRAEGRNDNLLKDLDAWDEKIIQFGSVITEKRLGLISFLSEKLEKLYQSISGDKEKIKVEYKSKIIKEKDAFPLNKISFVSQVYTDEIAFAREKDIIQAKTTIGPHRDDLVFFIDGKDITTSASRGEFRTLLLAIKLAEIDFIKEKTDQHPLLLLDDVFSELDKNRQELLLKAIKNCQTIIATTDTENIEKLASDSILLALES